MIHADASRMVPLLGLLLLTIAGAVLLTYVIDEARHPELRELSNVSFTQQEYSDYFARLARTKGAPYAFEILYQASFPPGIDTHTVGHQIGYILHEEQGNLGITFCSEHYRDDSCVHGVVIQEFVLYGREALARLVEACESLAGNPLKHTGCFHGLGHGIVAYLAYDYEQAVGECKAVADLAADAATKKHELLWKHCLDGATMEQFSGAHDKEAWRQARAVHMPDDDVLMPCNASYLPERLRESCYIYVRSRLLAAADIASTEYEFDTEKYQAAFGYCNAVSTVHERKTCYAGFGMHLVFAVNGNDDRTFSELSSDAMRTVHAMCMLAPEEGHSPCISVAADTIFMKSGSMSAASAFCELSAHSVLKDRCYTTISQMTRIYKPGGTEALCTRFPEPYWKMCREPFAAMK